jgi:hypothetical protein
MGRTLVLAGLVWACLAPNAFGQAPGEPGVTAGEVVCRDALGRTPVVESGRESDVLSLLVPHSVGEKVAETDWRLDEISIDQAEIELVLRSSSGRAHLLLSPAVCDSEARERTRSFAIERHYAPDQGSVVTAFDALVAAVRQQDNNSSPDASSGLDSWVSWSASWACFAPHRAPGLHLILRPGGP